MRILEFQGRIVSRAWVRRSGGRVTVQELPIARHLNFWAGATIFAVFFGWMRWLVSSVRIDLFGEIFGLSLFFGLPTALWGLALLPWNCRLVLDLPGRRALVKWRFLLYTFRAQSLSLEGASLAPGLGDHQVPAPEPGRQTLKRDLVLHAMGTPFLAVAPLLADMTTEQVPALVMRTSEHEQALLLASPPVIDRILAAVPELDARRGEPR
jgi:hypothetical protein